MCGIAGLVCLGDACGREDHAALVRQMCSLQRHRGPDDEGVVPLGKVCLGAVRLSILDLTDAGRMPMADEQGDWWISYNGEVYNFKELRRELIDLGHAFRSQTDTEVVLHAYKEWGEASLDRFVGMFAFAVCDRRSNRLTLVRDRFGIKPLYYMRLENHLFFSSEIKALTKVNPGIRLNRQGLLEWSLYRNVEVLSPETLFEDVYSVLPGQRVVIEEGKVSHQTYYFPPAQVDESLYGRFATERPDAVVEQIEGLLTASTRDRLVSDVPLGTLCSGGLDSSLITALAARDSREVTAFNVSIEGYPSLDEKIYAEEACRALDIPLVSYAMRGEVFRRELPGVIYACDLPLSHPNSVAYALICQVARDNGVIVLLSGEGADELFGGYRWRYRRHRTLLRVIRLLRLFPRQVRRGVQMVGYASAGMPATSLHFDSLLPVTVSMIDNWSRSEWRRQCEDAYRFIPDLDDRSVLGTLLGDLSDFLTPLLRRLDRTSMSRSIEVRVPFLDHRMVRMAVNLPLDYRSGKRSDKWVLKQIARRYLPGRIANREKVGFPLPLDDYLKPLARPDLFNNGFCAQVLGMRSFGIRDLLGSWDQNIFAFFNLLTLEIWGRLFILGHSLDEVNESMSRLEPRGS